MGVEICDATKESRLFSHYAYGDPLPVYARYFDGDGVPVEGRDAATIYIRCQREVGHGGKHLAFGVGPWD